MRDVAVVKIPVRFERDEETGDWHFHARLGDTIGIVGGGQATLEGARQAAAEAIAVALATQETQESQDGNGRLEYLDVAVG